MCEPAKLTIDWMKKSQNMLVCSALWFLAHHSFAHSDKAGKRHNTI
jgi:hypothetical protein